MGRASHPTPPAGLRGLTFVDVDGREYAALFFERPIRWMKKLSPAEREVASFLLDGKANADIARARGVAVRTVANQVASLYRKLGIRSRGELLARYGL